VHSDQDSTNPSAEGHIDAQDDTGEESMSWLLDLDRSEPEEKLFTVDAGEYLDEGLSEYEAELAARPLSRGAQGGDDFSMFVAEEIVVSSDSPQGGSFSQGPAATAELDDSAGVAKALDHSRKQKRGNGEEKIHSVDDGSDILGLAEQDDMGEKFLTIKRVKASAKKEETGSATVSASAEPAPEPPTQPVADSVEYTQEDGLSPESIAEAIPTSGEGAPGDLLEEAEAVGTLDIGLGVGDDDASIDDEEWLSDAANLLDPEVDAAVAAGGESPEPGADEWLGDVELELVVEAAAGDELSFDEPDAEDAANQWLEDIDLELVAEAEDDADDELSLEETTATASAEQWLGDVELELAADGASEESLTLGDDPGSDDAEQWLSDLDLSSGDATDDLPALEEAAAGESEDWLSDMDDWLGDEETGKETVEAQADPEEESLKPYDPIALGDDLDEAAVELAESEASIGEDDEGRSVFLSEAPVTGQVAEPGDHSVANEEPVPESEELAASAGTVERADDNVLDYVAQNKAPLDDEAFDEYLLRGAELAADNADLEELQVETAEGAVALDPTPETGIDYHDDFRSMEGFDQVALREISPVISGAMEEILVQARARLEELGRGSESLELDVMLGTNPESVTQCLEGGYEPVSAICPELPMGLAELDEAATDMIHVRLFDGQTNEGYNALFREDTGAATDVEAPDSVNGQAADGADAAQIGSVEALDEAGFGDDIFAEDIFDDDMMSDLQGDSGSDEGDIDALFGELSDEDSDAEDMAMEALSEVEPEPESESEESTEEAEVALADDAGFGEDIFADDLPELSELAAENADDIDSVFAGLAAGETESDAICGLDVDEFEGAEEHAPVPAAEERVQPVNTVSPALDDTDMGWCIPEGITFNYTSASGNEIFADFLDAFIEEGTDVVEKLEDAVGEWERDVASEAAFAPVGRILHTLKGIAKGVGLQRYGTLIHNFETLLEHLQRPEEGEQADYFRIVNAWLDATVRGLEFVREKRVDIASELPGQAPTQERDEADAPDEASAAAAESDNTLSVSQKLAERQKKRDQQLADEGAKALAAQQSVRITSEKLDHLLNMTNQAQQLGVRSAQSTTRSKRAAAELQGRLTSVRNHIAKIADRALLNVTATGDQQHRMELDALEMDQYSELQEAANILREAVEDLADLVDVSSKHNASIETLLKQQATVISTIGSSLQAARVVPVSRLMPGLRRIVRTVSADLDKSVSFKVVNETGALDRDHYARCQVVLEHMVRNALDHGIESPEERLAVGKATTGRISIDVRKSGGDYFITLSDDGRGIDPYEMREAAFRKGLDVDVDALSDEEAINLIFHKGFSTAATLSEISGRGVGMDIVLSELQQIGGDVKVHSRIGEGTSFEVHIPAHVSVNGALFVTAGQSSYAVPLNGLVGIEHVPVDDFFNAVERRTTVSLSEMDCEPAYLATLCQGESLPDRESWGATVPVIVAGSEKRYMAIAIDNLEEALELVIRSLGPQFANVPGVAGAATTSDGEAVVALDLNLLVESVASGSLSPVSLDQSKDKTMLALVVDDSRTQRMVTTSQFDTVGVETISAENGLVAIDLLNTTHRLPDVILLDVEMPVKDGIETLREIRKSVRYNHLPVIMVTSRTGAKHRALAEEAGCNGYMGKPFNFPALVEQINELTGYNLSVE
jgi:chemosensory pili system protein ChpA (sensor histidine kinase/response regulator)